VSNRSRGLAERGPALSDMPDMSDRPPRIGITCDVDGGRHQVRRAYADLVYRAGGMPLLVPFAPAGGPAGADSAAEACVDLFDGFILSGGDDPDTTAWGVPMHPEATPVDPDRQAFESALLRALDRRAEKAVLGVCLGMQMMALHAGGELDQFLADDLPTAGDHWGQKMHAVTGRLGNGLVLSHHRQAMRDPGSLRVVATAGDGVIEAVDDLVRAFYLGVQWHPERTEDERLGAALVAQLVAAAAEGRREARP